MPVTTDDDVGDLDDPISLVAFENIKTEKCDSDTDQIIYLEDSTDEESVCTSSYGKKSFFLPVTFFDISRNVRLLNKCKPMCIKIVDCKQYPTYYNKNVTDMCKNQSEDSGIEVFSKNESNSQNEPSNANMEYVLHNPFQAKENADKMQDKRKNKICTPRGLSFYEKLKNRKEHKKENAIKCKDLSQVDFKRNKGLVGLKIKESVFQKIVDTEKALSKAKSDSGENNFKDKSGSERENVSNETKTNLDNSTYNEKDSDNNTTLLTIDSNLLNDKSTEQPIKDKRIEPNSVLSCIGDTMSCGVYSEKTETNIILTVIEPNNNSDPGECIANFKTNSKKTDSETTNIISVKKHKEKTEMGTNKTNDEMIHNISDNKHKENNKINTKMTNTAYENISYVIRKDEIDLKTSDVRSNIHLVENIYKKRDENNIKKITTDTNNISRDENTKWNIAKVKHVKDKYKKRGESRTKIIFPATTRTTFPKKSKEKSHVTKNTAHIHADCVNAKSFTKSDTTPANNMETLESKNNNANNMRCSLKIPSKKIIEKVLKLKQSKNNEIPPDTLNEVGGQATREAMNESNNENQKLCLKSNNQIAESVCLVSSNSQKHSKFQNNTFAESKQIDKSTAVDINVDDEAGSNSPVIPCTTLTFRATQTKLFSDTSIVKNLGQSLIKDTAKLSTSNQTKFHIDDILDSINIETNLINIPPKALKGLNEDSINSKLVTSQKSVSHSNVSANVNKIGCTAPNQISSSNSATEIVERKYPYIFVRMGDSKSKVLEPTPAKNTVSDLSHVTDINCANSLIPLTKSATTGSASSVNNRTTNGANKNRLNNNTQVASLPSNIKRYSGSNATIKRKTPSRDLQKEVSPIRGQPIQTVINYRFLNSTIPTGGTRNRFQVPPRYLAPNSNSSSNISSAWPSNQRFVSQSGPPCVAYVRFPTNLLPRPASKPVLPPTPMSHTTAPTTASYLPPPPPPLLRPSVYDNPSKMPPPTPQNSFNRLARVHEISKDSVIGSTADGELIKKINIIAPETVSDKDMMLAELNNAVMSPELAIQELEHISKECRFPRTPGDSSKTAGTAKEKYSKPCPLSKKNNVYNNENSQKLTQNNGYSPPILPILTYEDILTRNDKYKTVILKSNARTAAYKRMHNTAQKRRIPQAVSGKQYQAKKISFADYRNRAGVNDDVDQIDASKRRKSNNAADDYNQDQGYDSDSTVKL